jgi:hypothetical protein
LFFIQLSRGKITITTKLRVMYYPFLFMIFSRFLPLTPITHNALCILWVPEGQGAV